MQIFWFYKIIMLSPSLFVQIFWFYKIVKIAMRGDKSEAKED